MGFPLPTDDDLATIAAQLGRRPQQLVGIAARCPAGHPSSIVTYPLVRAKGRLAPFPTLFWLSCPELVRAISRLEAGGLIRTLDDRLGSDPEFAAALRRNHEEYVATRWRTLTAEDRKAADAGGLGHVFRERGIGGLTHWGSVKCLHLHFAHHLASANVIGSLLEAEYGVSGCPARGPAPGPAD